MVQNQFDNHTIKIDISGEDFSLFGYQSEFIQVLLILLHNAKDALVESRGNSPKVWIILSEKKRRFQIIDNAGGIKSEIIEHIFEQHRSTKLDKEGSGIGLHLAKVIIEERMGYRIVAENSKEGAIFTIMA